MLSKDAIEEFRTLYQQETGVSLSFIEASQRATKFMKLVRRTLVEINGKMRNMKGQVNDKQK